MKVTYNWLKDFLDIKIPPRELADKLTMMGLEVGSIEEAAGDFIFEIEITSNRPDWLSVVGLSREIAAVTGKSIKDPYQRTKLKENKKSPLQITIENKKDCPFYTGRVIKNIKVGPASGNIIKRLELIGCRSVNNVVDITNYVLFESGQPLHAFDLDKLGSDKIMVRRAKKGEKILAIDGQEKMLNEDVLVIANHQKPVAIAGIMGGKDTEVDINTKNVLLESAVFDPVVVRRSRQILGLQSDSSYRFERCVDA
ncbi:phenylalanine--tRNA ligase subunit beta, partial [bacterium]